MRKIIFHCGSLGIGGAEHVILNLINAFRNDGYIVKLITTSRKNNEYSFENENRYVLDELIRNNTSKYRNIYLLKELINIIKSEKPDVVVTFLGEPICRIVLARCFIKFKSIVSVRNDPEREFSGKIKKLIREFILPYKINGMVFQTKDAKRAFPMRVQDLSRIILNQVEQKFFETEYIGGGNIVSIGRIAKQKNYKLLIDAFELVLKEYNVKLEIYGVGPMAEEIEEYIKEKKLQKKVFMKGYCENIEQVLKYAKMLVLSSDYEGMPNTVLEALAVGVPVISTDCPCGGPRMVINNGINGLLVPVKDRNKMADAIKRLLNDDKLAKSISEEAKETAKMMLPEKIYMEWKEYINEIINS